MSKKKYASVNEPGDRSLEAYKAWLRGITGQLFGDGIPDGMDDAQWEEHWQAYWLMRDAPIRGSNSGTVQ